MLTLIKSSTLAVSLAVLSLSVSAQQVTYEQWVGYTLAQQVQDLQFDLQAELEQSTYNLAFASLSEVSTTEGRRPVVTFSDFSTKEADEE